MSEPLKEGFYLKRLPNSFLCLDGEPIRFDTKEDAQARLDHESIEDAYEIWHISEDA